MRLEFVIAAGLVLAGCTGLPSKWEKIAELDGREMTIWETKLSADRQGRPVFDATVSQRRPLTAIWSSDIESNVTEAGHREAEAAGCRGAELLSLHRTPHVFRTASMRFRCGES